MFLTAALIPLAIGIIFMLGAALVQHKARVDFNTHFGAVLFLPETNGF